MIKVVKFFLRHIKKGLHNPLIFPPLPSSLYPTTAQIKIRHNEARPHRRHAPRPRRIFPARPGLGDEPAREADLR